MSLASCRKIILTLYIFIMKGHRYIIPSFHNSFIILRLLIIFLVFLVSCSSESSHQIDLAGTWQFAVDSADIGLQEQWFSDDLKEQIILPGSMAENKKGFEVSVKTAWTGQIVNNSWYTDSLYAPYRKPDNIKIPFWLTPVKHYVGPAWYRRIITIPEEWGTGPVELYLERTHWEAMAWFDSIYLGMKNSLSTPNVFRTPAIEPGIHTLTIRIDNRIKIDVGLNAHSVSDHTQTNWNGLIGKLVINKIPDAMIEIIEIFPNLQQKSAKLKLQILNHTDNTIQGSLIVQASSENMKSKHHPPRIQKVIGLAAGLNQVELVYPLGQEMLTWDEFAPAFYQLVATLEYESGSTDYNTVFGMREFKVNGTQFEVNGRKTFLRGTLECAVFPLTGYPPTDIDSWKKIMQTIKDFGLNHMRFHSWCPPEAAFKAADEIGIYLQVECGAWASIGNGEPIDNFIMAESKRIVMEYGNHPSFCMMAYGNEPGGSDQGIFLTKFLKYWKERDPRRVYTGAAGWPVLEENDYHNIPEPRGHQWGAGLSSRFNSEPLNMDYDYGNILKKYNKPVVSHEIGQWCVFPDLSEIEDYTGVLKAKNFEIVRDNLQNKGMLHQAQAFLLASGKWQSLLYKEEIETALRTPGFAGFQLLDLHDFPGQGTALVGVLNPFWETKGYINAEEFKSFCNDIVPLVRLTKRVYTNNEKLEVLIEISNYSKESIESEIIVAVRYPDGRVLFKKTIPKRTIQSGGLSPIDTVIIPIKNVSIPSRLKLSVGLKDYFHRENNWDIWVYPEMNIQKENKDIAITENIDSAINILKNGGKVLLNIPPKTIGSDVPSGFTTIFWNTAWTRKQKPHTLGILCDPDHPVFGSFPTNFHSNWQWYDIIAHSRPMNLDSWPGELSPLIQVIDDWNTNRKLGLLIEAKVGNGKLLLSSIDFNARDGSRLVSDQLKSSIFDYMISERFDPEIEIDENDIYSLVGPLY